MKRSSTVTDEVIEKFDKDTRAVHQVVVQLSADRNEALAIVCMVMAQLLRSGTPPADREPLLAEAVGRIRTCWDMLDDVELEKAARGGDQ